MEITHKTKNIKIAPRKLRLVTDAIMHQKAELALGKLGVVNKKAAPLVAKSLKSAIQVAKDNNLNSDSLVIQRIYCDEGMKLKRMVGCSRGRMARIMKHYSHLSIVLQGENKVATKKAIKKVDTKIAKSVEKNEVATNNEVEA